MTLSRRITRAWQWLALFFVILNVNGCAILFGNVKPVTDRSDELVIPSLETSDSDWVKRQSESSLDNSDVSFQSKKTASIISVTSTCRPSIEESEQDLHQMTDMLLLGITGIHDRHSQELLVDGQQALQTTLRGTLQDQPMQIRTVVTRKQSCLYDLMYIARPERFAVHEKTFDSFVRAVKLK